MNSRTLAAGLALIITAGGLIAVWGLIIKPEYEAKAILTESSLIMERGDRDSLNLTINTLRKVFVAYPKTKAVPQAYMMTAEAYEKLGLYRLAYLKYSYLFRKPLSLSASDELKSDALVHMNKIRILRNYTEEGVHSLYNMLDSAGNTDLRSKIYSELGQAYLKNNDVTKAKSSFDIALQENSNNEEAILGKARSLKRSGQDSQAYTMYDYFLKYYGSVSPYTADVKSSYMNELYNSGLSSFRAGHYLTAVEFFDRYQSRFGGTRLSENAFYWAGESRYARSEYASAIKYFDRVLTNGFYHKDEDARIKKAYALFALKRFDRAAKEFQTYLRENPRGRFVEEARRYKEICIEELQGPAPKAENDSTGGDGDESATADQGQSETITEDTQNTEDTEDTTDSANKNTQPNKLQSDSTNQNNGSDQPTDGSNPYGNEEVAGKNKNLDLDNIMEL